MRGKSLEDAVAEGVAELGIGHAAVEGECRDEHHVVHACLRGEIEYRFDHALARVGGLHRWQRERDVVERDREPHTGEEQRAKRLRVTERVVEGVSDGLVGIREGIEGFRPVDDPGPDREPLEPESLAVPNQRRRSRSIDLEDEAGPRTHIASLVGAAFGLSRLELAAS